MKKILNVIVATVFGCWLLSCEAPQRFVVSSRLDVPVYTHPVVPGDGYIWIEGEWFWNGRDYNWRNGYWSHPLGGYRWMQGDWRHRSKGWYWRPGRWRR